MCGICGLVTKRKLTKSQYSKVRQLIMLNEVRGKDSTGISLMYGNGKVHTLKIAEAAHKFVTSNEVSSAYNSNVSVVLGHTRLATTGEVNSDNAHPFTFGNITGIHNGMISNWRAIYGEGKVDSEAIFYELNRDNNLYVEAFKKIEGQAALGWTDNRTPKVLYLAKHGNPLFIAKTIDGVYFSSQRESLEVVLMNDGADIIEANNDYAYEVTGEGIARQIKINFKQYVPPAYTVPSYPRYYRDDDQWYPHAFGQSYIKWGVTKNKYQKEGWNKLSGVGHECNFCKRVHFTRKMYSTDDGTVLCQNCLDTFLNS